MDGHERADAPPIRQTVRVWEADLGDEGRRLTLEELRALETMHQCQAMARIMVALETAVRVLSSLEGRFDRLEQFLVRLDPQRYPQTPQPQPQSGAAALSQGRDDR